MKSKTSHNLYLSAPVSSVSKNVAVGGDDTLRVVISVKFLWVVVCVRFTATPRLIVKIYFCFATRGCPMWLDVVTVRKLRSKPQGGEAVNVAQKIKII